MNRTLLKNGLLSAQLFQSTIEQILVVKKFSRLKFKLISRIFLRFTLDFNLRMFNTIFSLYIQYIQNFKLDSEISVPELTLFFSTTEFFK